MSTATAKAKSRKKAPVLTSDSDAESVPRAAKAPRAKAGLSKPVEAVHDDGPSTCNSLLPSDSGHSHYADSCVGGRLPRASKDAVLGDKCKYLSFSSDISYAKYLCSMDGSSKGEAGEGS